MLSVQALAEKELGNAAYKKKDFEALRKQRNDDIEKIIQQVCDERGWERAKITSTFNPDSCYCACAEGGPCEHDFQGWREFDEGRGGERVCSRCGMGAMSHSLRCAP